MLGMRQSLSLPCNFPPFPDNGHPHTEISHDGLVCRTKVMNINEQRRALAIQVFDWFAALLASHIMNIDE